MNVGNTNTDLILIGRDARGYFLAARGNMIQASLLAGIAFNNAFLGLAHAIASPLGKTDRITIISTGGGSG